MLHSGNSRVSLSLRAGLGQNLAFLRNVQRIAECIVHFFLIEELVAEDDQLVIVD